MVLISHRGNVSGKNLDRENTPSYIDEALSLGYDVEIDIRVNGNQLFLGHDKSQYPIDLKWLEDRKDNLWIHCKNHEAVEFLNGKDLNWFWHDSDDMTLTSHGFIWAHPKIKALENSIAVIPEVRNQDLTRCLGVCSDYIQNYK